MIHNVVFYWYSNLISYTQTHQHTQHTQGPVDWHTHVNTCLHHLLCAYISYLYYIKWLNVLVSKIYFPLSFLFKNLKVCLVLNLQLWHSAQIHHPSLSTQRSKGLSHSEIKWWAIYTNLPVNALVRLTHPCRGDSQSKETFLAPSADKQTCDYDTECSNHYPSYQPWGQRDWAIARWNGEPCIQIYQ